MGLPPDTTADVSFGSISVTHLAPRYVYSLVRRHSFVHVFFFLENQPPPVHSSVEHLFFLDENQPPPTQPFSKWIWSSVGAPEDVWCFSITL